MKHKHLLTVKYLVASLTLGLFGLVGLFSTTEAPVSAATSDVILSVTIDNASFDLDVISPSIGGQVGSSFSLDVSGSNISTVEVYIDLDGDNNYEPTELIGTFTVNEDGSFGPGYIVGPVNMPAGTPAGSYNMKVIGYQKTSGGGTAEVTIPINYTQTAPQISKVEPNFGSVSGGTDITITGQNFDAGSKVYIGGKECLNVVISSTLITCTTPAGTEGRAPVTITGSNGTYTDTYGFLYIIAGSGGGVAGLPNVPNTGLFRVGDTVIMSSDLIIAGLAALVILLAIVLFKENRQSQHKTSKVSTKTAVKKVAASKKAPAKTPVKRVRSKKYSK